MTSRVAIAPTIYDLGQQTRKLVSGEHLIVDRGPGPAEAWRQHVIPALSQELGSTHLAPILARAEHAALLLMGDAAKEGVSELRAALSAAALPEDDPRAARMTLNLARGLAASGELHEALQLFERYQPLGHIAYDSWCGVADAVAWICARLGLWSRGAQLPAQHLIAGDCLPWFHLFAGELDNAERLWRETAEAHPWMVAEAEVGLTWCYIADGRFDEARALLATKQGPEIEDAMRACADENAASRPKATVVITARLGSSAFSMVPDILALLWHEHLVEPTLLQTLCGTDTTPGRIRSALLADLVAARPTSSDAQSLRLAAAADGPALFASLRELPNTHDTEFWRALSVPLGRALAALTGSDLRRFGDVDQERLALASELLERCPDAVNTHGGRHVRAIEGRWTEVLASIEHALARDDLYDLSRAVLRAERHAALGHVDAQRQTEEHRQRTCANLERLAELTSGMRDRRLRDHILPAFAPWVWDWDSVFMDGVPMTKLTELKPIISRRDFYRVRMNAQPALRDILAVCRTHEARTTFGGKLYLSPGLRFDSVTTVLTDATVAAFADTADDLCRVDGDRLHAWWD